MRRQADSIANKINLLHIFIVSWLMAFIGPILGSLISGQAQIMRPWLYASVSLLAMFSYLCKEPSKYHISNKTIRYSLFLTGILFSVYPVSRYYAVETNGFDFSVFDWMTRHTFYNEIGFEPIHSLNHYSIHASWILIPITIVRLALDHPVWLIGFGGFTIWMAVIPLWFLSILMTKNRDFSLLICFAYLTNSVTSATLNSFFRIECFYPLALFSFLLAWEKERIKFWIPSLLFFLSIKEDAALYLLGFSSYLTVFSHHKRKTGVAMLIGSFLLFCLNIKYLQPIFATSEDSKQFLSFWGGYGTDLRSIIITMMSSPIKVFSDILTSGWWKIYLMLGFIPLFSLRIFFFSLPGIFLLGTASGSQGMHQYNGYYPIVLMALAFVGCIDFMKKRGDKSQRLRKVCFIILMLFPLHHASSIRFNMPNFQLYEKIQEAKPTLNKYYQHRICVQANLIPYLGYDWPIETLTKDCLQQPNSVVVLSEQTNPYPFHKNEISHFIHHLENKVPTSNKNKWITILIPALSDG